MTQYTTKNAIKTATDREPATIFSLESGSADNIQAPNSISDPIRAIVNNVKGPFGFLLL